MDGIKGNSSRPINLADAGEITSSAMRRNDPNTSLLAQQVHDRYENLQQKPTEENGASYAAGLASLANTAFGFPLSSQDLDQVKQAAASALTGAGLSETDVQKALSDAFPAASEPGTFFKA